MKNIRYFSIFLLVFCVVLGIGQGCGTKPGQTNEKSENPSDGGDAGSTPLPLITIISPARAAMLTGNSSVKVEGKLNIPGNRVGSLKINGLPIQPQEDGSFFTKVKSKWGVNTVSVEVLDKDGEVASRTHSYIWSSQYRKVDDVRSPKAAIARINQKGIDDNQRADLNDLASILEFILTDLDLDALFPTLLVEGVYKIPPVGPKVKYKVTKEGKIKVGRRQVTMKARNGGILIEMKLKNVELPIKGSAGKRLNKSATILASEITLIADVDLRYANGQVVVDFKKVDLDVSKIEVKAFSGIWKFLNKLVTKKVRTVLKEKLEGTIKTLVPPLLGLFIKSFKLATDFTLPALLGGAVLSLDSGLDYLAFDDKGGTVGLAATVTSAVNIPDTKLGVPLRGQLVPKWNNNKFALGIAISYNMINQILAATWQSGALKQDLSSFLGTLKLPMDAKNVQVKIDAQLPPVLHPGTNKDTLAVGVGGLKMIISFEDSAGAPTKIQAYVAARFGAKLALSSKNELSIQLETTPEQLSVDILEVQGLAGFKPGDLNDIVKTFVPKVVELLTTGVIAKFPIPSLDLSTIIGKYGIPPGTNLSILNGQFSLLGDYIKVTGDL